MIWLTLLLGCGGDTYIVEGTVVAVNGWDEVIIDHKEVPGLMGPMTMPFHTKDPELFRELKPGSKVIARLKVEPSGGYLEKVRVVGQGPAPAKQVDLRGPLRLGAVLKPTILTLEDGTRTVIGKGQPKATIVTFIYTRCPLPEFCPATIARFQALQEKVPPNVRLIAITLDPAHDTEAVLREYAKKSGADPAKWQFGRAEGLDELVMSAGMTLLTEEDTIVHAIRVLVLEKSGRLIARYDDHHWELDKVIQQALTGKP